MKIILWLLALMPFAAALAQGPQVTGAQNFRDLGGLATADGHVVDPGLVYRSGELSGLTSADFQALAPSKIRYIFDLRIEAERSVAPTRWGADKPTIISVPLGSDDKEDPALITRQLLAEGTDPTHVAAALKKATVGIAIEDAPAIGRILLALSRGDEPAIIHCSGGKDRTGVVSAILLTLLGVSRDDVYKDYLRSNAAAPAQMMRLRQASSGTSHTPFATANIPDESLRILVSVDQSYLEATFAAIDAKYGSFDAYVSDGLKLTPSDITALRKRLTR